MSDVVNHPPHYSGAAGVPGECIDYAEELGYVLGNAFKYIYRAGKKNPRATLEDLQKARFYLTRHVESNAYHWPLKRAERIKPASPRAVILKLIARAEIPLALDRLNNWIEIEEEASTL